MGTSVYSWSNVSTSDNLGLQLAPDVGEEVACRVALTPSG